MKLTDIESLLEGEYAEAYSQVKADQVNVRETARQTIEAQYQSANAQIDNQYMRRMRRAALQQLRRQIDAETE